MITESYKKAHASHSEWNTQVENFKCHPWRMNGWHLKFSTVFLYKTKEVARIMEENKDIKEAKVSAQ